MTPIRALRRQAETNPDGTAFIAGGAVWTYGRMAAEVDRLARAMLARGVGSGDRVALHMANVPELVLAYYACFRLGAIAAPLNIRLKAAELRPLLARLRPALYLGQAQLHPEIAGIDPEILAAHRRYVIGDLGCNASARPWARLLHGAAGAGLPADPDSDRIALLQTTSGTTGVPKLVGHTLATRAAGAEAFAYCGFGEGQVVINAMPMMHGGGLSVMLACIRFGEPMILLERFDPEHVLDAIDWHRGSWFGGLPFMFGELSRCQRAHPRQVSSLRMAFSAGDVTPPAIQDEFREVFGVPLLSIWGATEAPGALIAARRPGPTGRLRPGSAFRLVDEAGADVARGEMGELLVRSPGLAVGYWKGPGELEPLAPDGWFHTGDLMRQGEGDEFWFVARKKDLIIRGGSNISPLEVERVLMMHPAVRDAAVVGIPDKILGQRVAAAVALKGEVTGGVLTEILHRSRKQLADYKVPERLTVLPEIPRGTLGKVDRKSVAAMLPEAGTGELAASR